MMMMMFGCPCCSRFMKTQRLCGQRRSVQNVPQSVNSEKTGRALLLFAEGVRGKISCSVLT